MQTENKSKEEPAVDTNSPSRIDIVMAGGNPQNSTHTAVASSSEANWKNSKPIS